MNWRGLPPVIQRLCLIDVTIWKNFAKMLGDLKCRDIDWKVKRNNLNFS